MPSTSFFFIIARALQQIKSENCGY